MIAQAFDMDELVAVNNLLEVTSPIIFERGGAPKSDGLLSTVIFGNTVKDRRSTHAYIGLGGMYFAPLAYTAIKSLFRNIDGIISGAKLCKITKNGQIELCSDDDPNGQCGLQFIYDNWNKLKWEKSDNVASKRNEHIDFMMNHEKNEIFVSKLLLLPVFYRDIDSSGADSGQVSNDPLNNMYTQIIRYSSMLKTEDTFGFILHQTHYKVQRLLIDIYDYFKQKIHKKNGMIRKYLLGKNTSYAVRSVITSPSFRYEYAKDMHSTIDTVVIPMAQVVVQLYPFIVKWIRDYFDRTVIRFNTLSQSKPKNDTNVVNIIDPERYLNDKVYEKICNRFIKDPSSRFNTIEIEYLTDKKERVMAPIAINGKRIETPGNTEGPEFNRPLTYTDLLYLAAYDCAKGKHVIITRYPLLDHTGMYPNKIFVESTIKKSTILLNGQVYENYPVIDRDIPTNKIATLFADSIQLAGSCLPRLDGDFDGDQVTSKALWTPEANSEQAALLDSKKFLINVAGKMNTYVESEPVQTLYVLTKDPTKDSRIITQEEKQELLDHPVDKMSLSYLNSLFGHRKASKDRYDRKVLKPKFNPTDIINFTDKESPTKKAMKTTVGRYIVYKTLVQVCELEEVIPYYNEHLDNNGYKRMDDTVGDALIADKITVAKAKEYINQREWFLFELHAIVCTSYTPKVIDTPTEVKRLRNQLFKKYAKELSEGDPSTSELIEKELITKIKEIYGDDVGMDLYISGARGSIANNLKDMNLYKGAIRNPYTGKYDIVTSDFMGGFTKKDIPALANANITGSYPKAVGTATSGYLGKQLIELLQTYVSGSAGTDCGTKGYLELVLDKSYVSNKLFLHRYIIENGKLIKLTNENIDSYIGKKIKLRSPMYCKRVENGKLCSKCSGEQYYDLDLNTIGLLAMRISGTFTNAHMKKFHSNLIKLARFDVNELIK